MVMKPFTANSKDTFGRVYERLRKRSLRRSPSWRSYAAHGNYVEGVRDALAELEMEGLRN